MNATDMRAIARRFASENSLTRAVEQAVEDALADVRKTVIAPLLEENTRLRGALENEPDKKDGERLDWLDAVNAATNAHCKTKYGWSFDQNHNRAALTDCHASGRTVREAIDEAMGKAGKR